jgi:hypothetical protein
VTKGTFGRAAAEQDRDMLELISIIAAVIVCIMIPVEVGKVRKGWVHKKFAGDRPRFLAAYRKQLRMLMWLGLVFGVLGLGLAALEANHGEAIVKVVGAAIWLIASGLAFNALRMLAKEA